MVLAALYGVRTGIRPQPLRDVSLLVRQHTGVPLPRGARRAPRARQRLDVRERQAARTTG